MKIITQPFRLMTIYLVLLRYGLGEFLPLPFYLKPLRLLRFINPWYWFSYKHMARGKRIRLALITLGPIFVKFGQVLSTRKDLLPLDIALELAQLQDQVPPFPAKQAKAIIEKAFGKTTDELFAQFEIASFASASMAQIHLATLHSGEEVVVKVLRPGIKKRIEGDIALLYTLAKLTKTYASFGERLRPTEVVDEFSDILSCEQDLMHEAANASQLRRNFENSDLLYVPKIFWDYCRPNVMVMEKISGIQISDVDALRAQETDMKKLAERGVEIFFTQVFRDSFFHADMHPGNIFVSREHPSDPKYVGVDFGIMGTLTDFDKRYLAENLLAFFNRDYHRVATLHVESGWVPRDTRPDQFESAIRAVCEPIFEKPIKDISFGRLLMSLFKTAGRFNMPVQPQLMLLQKTLLNVEGLGRQLYPDLDLWTTAKPFLENWMKDQIGPRAILCKMFENKSQWLEMLPELPGLVHRFLEKDQAPTMIAPAPKVESTKVKPAWVAVALVLLGVSVGAVVPQITPSIATWFAGTGALTLLVGFI